MSDIVGVRPEKPAGKELIMRGKESAGQQRAGREEGYKNQKRKSGIMADEHKDQEQQQPLAGCGIRSVQLSCRPEENYLGEKSYRTVFNLREAEALFVDAELLNRQFGEREWETPVTVCLYWFDGEKGECVAEKAGRMKFGKEDGIVRYRELITRKDRRDFELKEGVYRVLVQAGAAQESSDDLFFMESHDKAEEYCRVLEAGLDRSCEETDEESKVRPHSFRTLNKAGLKDVRFYMMAQNLLKKDWVYEFVIRVLSADGDTKILRRVISGQYVQTPAGKHICFAVDLSGGIGGFWTDGEYTLMVSGFDQHLFTLHFNIGNQDIPYRFEQEARQGQIQEAEAQPGGGQLQYSVTGKEDVLDRLYRLVGLRKVKEEITRITEYLEFIRLRRENGFASRVSAMHMIFTGHPGTGKNTVAEMIGELFSKLGLLSNGSVHHFDRNHLVQDGATVEEQLVRRALADSEGGVMFIDRAGDLFIPDDPNDRGVVALSVLMGVLVSENPDVLVILADEAGEIENMLAALPELKKVFTRQLCFEDYTPEELMEITRIKLKEREYRFTPAAEEKFYKILKAACIAGELDFTNGSFIDERIEDAEMRMSKRLMSNGGSSYKREELMLIEEADIVEEDAENPGIPLERLKTMVGLGQLKQSLLHHLNYIYFIRERQKHGFTDVMPPLNMIFSGNPGTGKLTVAKMIGEIYHATGIIDHPEVVVQCGRNLTAEAGLTPQQMAAALLSASRGGLLYIDEADALPVSEFGLALFELLLSAIPTEDSGDMVVVLAGYPDKIDKMLEMNPSLKDYFPYRFLFNDYTAEELLQIATDKLKEKDYALHPKALEMLKGLIGRIYDKKDKRFGNVLLIEKLVEAVIRKMSDRIMGIRNERELTRQEMTTILETDVPADILETPKFDRDIFNEEEIGQALKDLDNIVGQEKLKLQIRDFVGLARHYSQQGVKLSTRMSLQWCFTGNSALGKGTIARIIGRLYKAMGIVDKGHVLDFKVEKLIGLLEDEAQRSIGEALLKSNGGIFLFDEDSPKLVAAGGFRERVRAILMSQLAERPGSYIIIYAEPKSAVPGFNGGAGHMSEMVNILDFEDYTKEELMQILKRRLEKENMKLTATARRHMAVFIGMLVSTDERNHASSRLMRIVADLLVRNTLQRIAKIGKTVKPEEIVSVQKQDVTMFTEPFIAGLVNERKRIGFV